MGSISWVAIKNPQRGNLLDQLNLVAVEDTVSNHRGGYIACEIESGWYVILGDLFFDEKLSKENLSQNTELLSCFASETAMASGVAYYQNGDKVFSVEHTSDEGRLHLDVSGDVPQDFQDIRQAMLDKHEEAEEEAKLLGEDIDVDYFFSIPAMLSESLCGFRNDLDPTLEGRKFHALRYKRDTSKKGEVNEKSEYRSKIPFINSAFYEDRPAANTRVHIGREIDPTVKNQTTFGPLVVVVDERMTLDEFLLEMIKTDEPYFSNWIAESEKGGVSAALITQGRESVLICKRGVKMGELVFESRPVEMKVEKYQVNEDENLNIKICDIINNDAKFYKIDRKTGSSSLELVQMLPHILNKTHPAREIFNQARMNSFSNENQNSQELHSTESVQNKAADGESHTKKSDAQNSSSKGKDLKVRLRISCIGAAHEYEHGYREVVVDSSMSFEAFIQYALGFEGAFLASEYYVQAPDLCAVMIRQESGFKVICKNNITLNDLVIEGKPLTVSFGINDLNEAVINYRVEALIAKGVTRLDDVEAAWLGVPVGTTIDNFPDRLAGYPAIQAVLSNHKPLNVKPQKEHWIHKLNFILRLIRVLISPFR